jgi:curved DNA-binding protein
MVTLEEAMRGMVRPISMQTVNRQTGKIDRQDFQVRIPPGATDGRRIRVPGQGEAGQGGAEAGDLYLRVRHAAHPDFTTEGADLRHDLELAPWEAVLGAEVVVPTLDGPIKLKIPPFAENGQVMRVRTRGLPKGKSGERGDFLVTLLVRLPEALTEAERKLWEQLRDASTFQPRAAK